MKKMRLLSLVLLLSLCNATFAQIDGEYYEGERQLRNNTRDNQSYRSSYYYDNEAWGCIYASYSPLKLVTTYSGRGHGSSDDDLSFNAFTVGFSYTQPLSGPLCLETAFEATGAFFSESYYDDYDDYVKHKYELFNAKVPVNLVLRFDLGESFALMPYAGLNAKLNISGKETEDDGYEKTTWNLFDEDDMFGDTYKRFQLGYQAGVKLLFANVFSVSASYGGDLTPLYSENNVKQRFQGFSFSVGYNF